MLLNLCRFLCRRPRLARSRPLTTAALAAWLTAQLPPTAAASVWTRLYPDCEKLPCATSSSTPCTRPD